MSKPTALLGVLLLPLVVFPAFAGALLVLDHLTGERLLLHAARYDQRAFMRTVGSDFVAALPASYAWSIVVLSIYLAGERIRTGLSPLWIPPIGALSGWVLGSWLAGVWLGATPAALALAGTLAGVPMVWIADPFRRGSSREAA